MNSKTMLAKQLLDVGSKSEDPRRHAVRQIGRLFIQNARELQHDYWSKFISSIHEHISDLVNSSATHEQLGGLLLIQELIPLDCEDNASKLTNFSNFLRLPFGSSNDALVLQSSSHALGMLAQAGGNVDDELKRALQRLKVSYLSRPRQILRSIQAARSSPPGIKQAGVGGARGTRAR